MSVISIIRRNVEIDTLWLSDKAIEVLKNGQLNRRLLSELISHEDFSALLGAVEKISGKEVSRYEKHWLSSVSGNQKSFR
jgi:hypothetical protein